MKYLIFGAGVSGRLALHFLGYWRTECFIANSISEEVDGKRVHLYSELLPKIKEGGYIVAVASDKYYVDMVRQLQGDGVERYFVFREKDVGEITDAYPKYQLYRKNEWKTYTDILSLNHVENYKKIVVLGNNYYLPYLIAELAFLAGLEKIEGVIRTQEGRMHTLGIKEISYGEIPDDADCMIVNEKRQNSPLAERALDASAKKIAIINIFGVETVIPQFYHPELEKYKDIHKGKRCFIIGNGPSLTVSDLDTLYEHQEICFAFNKIFKIYDRTKWRPKYYGISDADVIPGCMCELPRMKETVFLSDEFHRIYDNRMDGAAYFHWIVEEYYPQMPGFSEDITRGTYFGYSVVYDIGLQFAAYMGFREIYLLGVDNSFTEDLTDQKNHFLPDYFEEEEKERYRFNRPHPKEISRAYEKAELYSKQRGIRIYNATRGGALEVFERVDFDGLFAE